MITIAPLTGSHLRTYNTIFQHPVSHNLEWRHVLALFRELGEVAEEPNGNLKVTVHGEVLVLRPARTKDVAETEELMMLRHFLERTDPLGRTTPTPAATAPATHWLVVIDHREARIFRSEMRGALPQTILPHAPDDFFRHRQDSKEFSRGKEKPDPTSFFAPVAQALQAPGPILVFGTGTGTSSEMAQFIAWLNIHHKELARRVVGAVVVDEHHLTADELLAKAREFYASPQTATP